MRRGGKRKSERLTSPGGRGNFIMPHAVLVRATSVRPSARPSVRPSVRPSARPSSVRPSVRPSVVRRRGRSNV